ncbi:50S ribosomal protein L6 [Methanocella sp. CWC-04]|uniref:Large ribosomal subunit protein uL6 n=1 Tax=Methanooceanicella nereidis TaxID=2052831 RepID=A0AAP2RAK8_9EURY|nr:50S ribosomal protein L6 [Methanocella sp. CWC-04]MCD1293497.1 50S ribosomal protein L6 [Methanocella sp. CWC-04]
MAAEKIREVEIPQGVTVSVNGATLTAKGQKGQISRDFKYPGISVKVDGEKVLVETVRDEKQSKATVGTYASHINNMITGVSEGFEYNMKIVYTHFPIQVKVEGKDSKVSIGNFLGERKPRSATIMGDTKVDLQGDRLVLTGINKEHVGQTAANIEQACRIRKRDPRVFQDGIYITKKA